MEMPLQNYASISRGVETHIYFLAQCLLQAGHKVIVITHQYGQRRGIRYLSNGLKVYYLPFIVAYNGTSLATILGSLPWFRKIFLRERIQLVHGHSTFSTMAHEAMFHGWCLGVRSVFTDHSLFGFADASAILTNTLVLHYSLANVCLSSHFQSGLQVSTIPNAIETSFFQPNAHLFYSNPTTIVTVGRLVYRKGADLLAEIIPAVCERCPQVRFIVGGDGPKRVDLEEMRERYQLHEKVIMLGTVPHDQVPKVLTQGQIFLNTSLTEAFCMTIVEAASCGLHVVSTRVGGIPEVLPDEFITLEQPVPELLVQALCDAVKAHENRTLMDPEEKHKRVREMYFWPDVAKRTETVYMDAISEPDVSWAQSLYRYYEAGIGFGILYIIVATINMLLITVLNVFDPPHLVPLADDEPKARRPSKKKSVQ